jgi:hypothetical protein
MLRFGVDDIRKIDVLKPGLNEAVCTQVKSMIA